MADKILVTGASGQQGGVLIRHLLKHGQGVRAMTRNPEKATDLKKMGVEVVYGDLENKSSVVDALKGIKRMFLVATPYEAGVDAEERQAINGVEAAAEAGVEHLLYSSVGSAQRNTGIPHFESKRNAEKRIFDLGLTYTILRPVFFMENIGSPWFLPSLKNGVVALPMKADRPLAMVALENIGEYGAKTFLESDKFIGEEIELAGDELTWPDALNRISKTTGAKIEFRALPHEGADRIFGEDLAKMYIWFDKVGYNPDIPELEKKYGIKAINFDEYLRSADWLKELRVDAKVK